MITRPATLTDFESFSEMNQEIQKLHAQAEPAIFKPEINIPMEVFEKYVSDPNYFMMMGFENNVCAGYVFCETLRFPESPYAYARTSLYLSHLFVKPEARGKGLAKQLLSLVKNFAQQNQITNIELDAWTFNKNAVALFKKFGFVTHKERMRISSI